MPMRVLWTHNFDPAMPNSQVYMNIAAGGLRALGVELHLEFLGNLRSPGNLRRARCHVREVAAGFDVVHAQYGSACALATAAVTGRPTVVSLRGNDWSVGNRSAFQFVHTRLARAMTRWALPRFDCVTVVSNRMGREVQSAFPRKRVVTIPSPLDLGKFTPRDRADARRKLGADPKEKWVVFNAINLQDPVKRFPLAEAAFLLARRRHPELRLKLVTGMRHADVPLLVGASDLLLCTSESEGWPNSVKEALACNVPFVSTDVSDLAEIARAEPACRVCAATPEALADGISATLAAGAQVALRRHVEPMDLGALSRQLLSIYQSLQAARPLGAAAPVTLN